MKDDEDFDFLLKIVIVGDSGVGKSNLLLRFSKDEFHSESKATIGVDFAGVPMNVGQYYVKAQFWDTAGQDKYRAITSAYYKNANGAILVYDIANLNSFKNLVNWVKEVRQYAEASVTMILLGNKSDLQSLRQVQTDEAMDYAKANNLYFMEVSALSNMDECVQKAFTSQVEEIVNKREKEYLTENIDGGKSAGVNLNAKKDPKKPCAC